MTDTLLGPLAELALRSVDDYAKKCGFSDEVLTLARRAAVIAAGEARDAAVAAEREKWQAALAELYWASDANYCDGDEARESFARLEAAQDAVVALLGGAGPAMAGARATHAPDELRPEFVARATAQT